MGIFESSPVKTKTKEKTKVNPWAEQVQPLIKGFDVAGKALDGANATVAGLPSLTAGFTPGQVSDLGALSSAGRQYAAGPAQTALQAGQAGMTTTPGVAAPNAASSAYAANAGGILAQAQNRDVRNNANGILSNVSGSNPSFNAGDIYNAAGKNIGQNANSIYVDANGGPINSKAGTVYGDVSGDKTDVVIGNAGKIASNPFLDGQIDSVLGDINRNFQIERGNINSTASGTGNINSTRAGTMEAYAAKDAMDRAATVSSDMRGKAYSEGLNIASANEANRQNSTLGANSQLQVDDQYRQSGMLDANGQLISAQGQSLDAQLGANSQLMSGQQSKVGQMLDANGQLLSEQNSRVDNSLAANTQIGAAADRAETAIDSSYDRFGKSLGFAQTGYEMGQTGLADSLTAGDRVQAQEQEVIKNKLLQAGLPLNLVQQYMETIGGSYGSDVKSKVKQKVSGGDASPFQQIVGGATSLGGIIGSLKGDK